MMNRMIIGKTRMMIGVNNKEENSMVKILLPEKIVEKGLKTALKERVLIFIVGILGKLIL